MYMKDIWNPTKEEIINWAYSNELTPAQDWELAVYNIENINLIISLICDEKCLKREFFLGCLYVFVGDLMTYENKEDLTELKIILEKASNHTESDIIDWISRSRELITHPETYSYKYWGLDSAYVYKWRLKYD